MIEGLAPRRAHERSTVLRDNAARGVAFAGS